MERPENRERRSADYDHVDENAESIRANQAAVGSAWRVICQDANPKQRGKRADKREPPERPFVRRLNKRVRDHNDDPEDTKNYFRREPVEIGELFRREGRHG